MKRWLASGLIVLFWLIMTGWLVCFEAFPQWFARTPSGYRDWLQNDLLIRDSWMKILFRGRPAGYSHSAMETRTGDPNEQYAVKNETRLRVNILGLRQTVAIASDAMLDSLGRLRRFRLTLSCRDQALNVAGRRAEGDWFAVTADTPVGRRDVRVKIPDDLIVYSPFVELALGRLKPGQEMRLRTLDPATLSPADLFVRATGRERLVVQGRAQTATVLTLRLQGIEMKGWMDDQGRMLRQETPYGWTMEACTAAEAMALLSSRAEKEPDVAQPASWLEWLGWPGTQADK